MSWTDITRAEHNRKSDRYPTDLTDAVGCGVTAGSALAVGWPAPHERHARGDERNSLHRWRRHPMNQRP